MEGFFRKDFTEDEIRKISVDMLDLARQLEKSHGDDECMKETCGRLRSVSVLLFTYFPPRELQIHGKHMQVSSSAGFPGGTLGSPL